MNGTPEVIRWVRDTELLELSTDDARNYFFSAYVGVTDYGYFAGQIPTI